MLRKLTRISPASCLAMVALFVALGGGAYAAAGKIGTGEIKNGAITKAKLKKNAVVTAKIKSNAVTGAKVNESSLGTVPDASMLGGKAPSGFESKGFGAVGDSKFVNLPKDAITTAASQPLPAGTYLLLARGAINNNSGESTPTSGVSCTVAAAGSSQTVKFGALAKNGAPGDHEEFSAFVIATLPSPGDAVLSCDTNGGFTSGNIINPTIAAVSLQP